MVNIKTLLFTQSGTKMPNVTFRAIEERDLEILRQWRNTPDVSLNMFSSGFITEEQQRGWYESVCRGERGYCWFVESDGQAVGYASLSRAERAEDTYEFGLYIGNHLFLGGGYGSAILFCIMQEAFEKLHAHKVICEVLAFNSQAIHLYEKFGMQKQGYFKDYLKRENKRIDCISYAIFEQEWQVLRNNLYEKISRC